MRNVASLQLTSMDKVVVVVVVKLKKVVLVVAADFIPAYNDNSSFIEEQQSHCMPAIARACKKVKDEEN